MGPGRPVWVERVTYWFRASHRRTTSHRAWTANDDRFRTRPGDIREWSGRQCSSEQGVERIASLPMPRTQAHRWYFSTAYILSTRAPQVDLPPFVPPMAVARFPLEAQHRHSTRSRPLRSSSDRIAIPPNYVRCPVGRRSRQTTPSPQPENNFYFLALSMPADFSARAPWIDFFFYRQVVREIYL